MDLPTALDHHLSEIVDGLENDEDSLIDALAALVTELRAAVSLYLGFRLCLVLDGWPVTLTAFPASDGPAPVTSMRLDLAGFGGGVDPADRIVFYAGTPGTFVDLAADYAYLHDLSSVALDVELPPPTVVSGVTGLTELMTINRALGVLLERGQGLEQARVTLHRRAGAAGMDLPGYAARLLGEQLSGGGFS